MYCNADGGIFPLILDPAADILIKQVNTRGKAPGLPLRPAAERGANPHGTATVMPAEAG